MRSFTCLVFLVSLYAVGGDDGGTAVVHTLSPDEFKARDLDIFNIRSWDDIKNHNSKYPFITLKVDVITSVYFSSINVSDAMTQLAKVGRLLQLAYAGSKGFPCSPMILKILLNYQGVVKDSLSASSYFVQQSILSLKYHRAAMKLAWNDKFDFALRALKFSYGIADKMMVECDKLIAESDLLIDQTTEAAVQAVKDELATASQKNATMFKIRELEVVRTKQETTMNQLQKYYDVEREAELKAEAEARTNEHAMKNKCKRDFWDLILSAAPLAINAALTYATKMPMDILPPDIFDLKKDCTTTAEEQLSAEARQRQKEARDIMRNYQDELIKANSDHAGTVQELLNAREVANELEASIKSLEITVAVLGRISTTFRNAKLFWMQVKRMAEARRLGDLIELFGEMASIDQEEKMNFIQEIRESGFGWLGLAKVNREAGKAIQEVNRNVDGIVNHLPTKAQAKQLIETLGAQILQEIQAETDRITKSQANLLTTMSPSVGPTNGGPQTDGSPTDGNNSPGVGPPAVGPPGVGPPGVGPPGVGPPGLK